MTFLKELGQYILLSLPSIGAYAMFAVGIVVIYRASRVLNLAHGAMAMVPAFVVYQFATKWHWSMVIAVPIGLIAGMLLGLVIERVFVRGMRHLSTTAQTVGTVAVLALLIAVASKVWGTNPVSGPSVFPKGAVKVGASALDYGSIGLFIVAVVVAVVMLALFKFTNIGLAMRGAAENRRAAALMGINPNRTTAMAWAIGGGLAALAGILLAGIATMHPVRLSLLTLPAYVAALMGALESLPIALFGAAVVGTLLGVVPAFAKVHVIGQIASQTGSPQLFLTIAALAIMYTKGQRFSVAARDDTAGFGAQGKVSKGTKRKVPALLVLIGIAALAAWIFIPGVPFVILQNANTALFYALVTVSLVVLTGWVGQISLGHAALVGIGAFVTGIVVRGLGVQFPLNLPIAAAVAALVAAALGAVALRVRGLYLAVATLVFSWMVDEFLMKQAWFAGSGGSSNIKCAVFGSKGGLPDFNLCEPKVIYLFSLAVVALGMLAAANIRSSKTGRAFFATRGSETAAASLGINVMRYKLLAFAISGALAGAAGNLFMTNVRTIQPDQFAFTKSLFFLSIAVVAGLRTLGGAALAAVLFASLDYLFVKLAFLSGWLDIVTSGLLVGALLLQAYAGRMTGVRAALSKSAAVAGRPLASVAEKMIAATSKVKFGRRRREALELGRATVDEAVVSANGDQATEPAAVPERDESGRLATEPVLQGSGITVRFGGLTAVSNASVEIRKGEIVGLIGPNGAGKTTFFNALSGLNEPTEGKVLLFGTDVSHKPVHERAKLGLGRTFQIIQLFGELSVRENLLVATHVHNDTGVVSHVLASDHAVRAERDAQRRVNEIIEILDLSEIADRPTAGLPFGLLRLVEIGRAVVTEAPIILLDEAASGLDNTETDRLVAFLRSLRERFGISMLLIEHDVQMVTGISDYMYVLNQGRLISEGRPEDVQRDPAVVAAYLGEPSSDTEASDQVPALV